MNGGMKLVINNLSICFTLLFNYKLGITNLRVTFYTSTRGKRSQKAKKRLFLQIKTGFYERIMIHKSFFSQKRRKYPFFTVKQQFLTY